MTMWLRTARYPVLLATAMAHSKSIGARDPPFGFLSELHAKTVHRSGLWPDPEQPVLDQYYVRK